MADDDNSTVSNSGEGGISGAHPDVALPELLVAPATAAESNRVTLRLIPVACWKIEDIRFAFDSSFVTPEAAGELQELRDLREAHAQEPPVVEGEEPEPARYPPLSIFGHADPVGDDASNKSLSGRRATVVYALLIVHTDPAAAVQLWRQVARTENWGESQKQIMQESAPEGTADADLFEAYMKTLCPPDLALTPQDFLSTGTDAKGKYQGCSSFNPVIVFSQQKQDRFESAAARNDKAVVQTRNEENAPNRRVMILLFRVGSQVDPAKWPCPRATEGIADCRKRFWGGGADGDTRRTTRLPAEDRLFEKSEDTFACRFYQRLTDASPCHGIIPAKPCSQRSFPPRQVDSLTTETISGALPPNDSWNGTYTWHAKFTVVVRRNPCEIRVIVKLRVTGAITAAQKGAWKTACESKWNGKVTLYCHDASCAQACPDGYPVVFSIEYVNRGEHQKVEAVASTLNMNKWGVNDTVDVTHEFGHMLGNPEEYFTTNGVNYEVDVGGVHYPFRSPTGTIMNNPANNPARRHYNLIRQEAGRAMSVTCSFTRPNPVGDFPEPADDEAIG